MPIYEKMEQLFDTHMHALDLIQNKLKQMRLPTHSK